MSNTDKYFKALTLRLQNDPAGLLALSEIMESHMRYSIDPRLSSDPLTALSSVMDHHLMVFEHEGLSVLSNAIQIFYSECGPTYSDEIKQDKDND